MRVTAMLGDGKAGRFEVQFCNGNVRLSSDMFGRAKAKYRVVKRSSTVQGEGVVA